ncbi:MAG: DEAD/DEAH box helicase [bacterium]|jgi:ATP-dependent RNA helicase RhlE
MRQNKTIVCRDCEQNFTILFREQISSKPPTQCPKCRSVEPVPSPEFAAFGLDPRLVKAVAFAGYENPTPVQSATIPIAMQCQDLIGTAQTGTGKTAAFVLPLLNHLLLHPPHRPCTRIIVLTPTRELAEQISDTFRQLAKFTKLSVACVYGGVGLNSQADAMRRGVDVIVACPGRLLDHMNRGNTRFSQVEKLVLDEADRMLDMGFLPQIKRVISGLPEKRHTMLFSATFAPELSRLVAEYMHNPQRLNVDLQMPPKAITHALYPCPNHLKTDMVLKLLDVNDTNSVLVFARTKHRADRVAEQISKAGFKTNALHSNKSQSQRQSALNDFKYGRVQVLVATDIAARGLDVESISHVINYDIPDTADAYIHRIGRTGRMETEGDAMTLITREDAGMVWDIEKALGGPIERRKIDGFDYQNEEPTPADMGQNASARHGYRPSAKGMNKTLSYGAATRRSRGRRPTAAR